MSSARTSPPLPDILPIQPFTRPAAGRIEVPGSKSITNRALLLGALTGGPVTLAGALFSEDTEIMGEALRRLGFAVTENASAKAITVKGEGGRIPAETAEIFVGNAGTAARFLTALCAASSRGLFLLDGLPQMRKRPMKGLIEALRGLGAEIDCPGEEGFFPLIIRARGLRGGRVAIDASESSQMLSALLMAAPLAQGGIEIELSAPVREPFVEMTRQLMRQFGVDGIRQEGRRVMVPRSAYRYDGKTYPIEPDATSASYFLALPRAVARGGALRVAGLHPPGPASADLQGDLRFIGALERFGLVFADREDGLDVSYEPSASLSGEKPFSEDFSSFSDTFLTLAALSPLLGRPILLSGIAHTRKQETDRVAGMARELRKLGQTVTESEDALAIHPQPLKSNQVIDTYRDHRFAMSFAILGCHDLAGNGQPWLSVRDPACCAKTFPEFFQRLDELRRHAQAS